MTDHGGPLLGQAPLHAFVPSSDLARSRRFYEGTLGLAVRSHDGFAVELDAHGTVLRVSAVGTFVPHPFTVLGWGVPDIVATCEALAANDVALMRIDGLDQDENGVWTAPSGARVAWFHDPDDNVLSVTQDAATVAD